MTSRVTLRSVSAAIAAAGGAETLERGSGYFYFADGSSAHWPQTAVYVNRLRALTVEQWVDEWRRLRSADER